MNISALFIRRPVATILLALAVVAFGVVGYRELPVSDLPNVDFPTILVTATLPGASPETMASSVATPLERQFSTIAGIDQMTSTSNIGSTQITLQFSLDRSIDGAAQDVAAAISAAARTLPPQMPAPPTFLKVNPALAPILYLAVTSKTLELSKLDEYAETVMAQRISMISGVAQVQVFGSQKYAVRAQVSPDALYARGIAIEDVASALEQANVNLPGGFLSGDVRAFTIQPRGQLMHAAQFRSLIVAYKNGAPVRLGELGRVVDSVENTRTAAWYIDQRALILAVQRQPGTNTIEVSQGILDELPKLEAELPASVKATVLFDRAASIRDSARDVTTTLLITLVLVVLVIFVFLRGVRATIIPSLALPMSVLGTFIVMWMLGYSLDNLSLMALTLSVGFVVDDAIVMLENIVRHVENGQAPRQAALDGAKEIGFTIVSMTLSLSAVFIPVLFMGGVIGRLFREFAATIGISILISGVVSLTLTPMLCSRLLKGPRAAPASSGRDPAANAVPPRAPSPFAHASALVERAWFGFVNLYARGLRWSLHHRGVVLLAAVAVLVATFALFALLPKGLFPNEDTGQLFASTEGSESISYDDMVRHQLAVADVVKHDPGVESFMSSVGSRGGIATTNTGVIFMRLKPRGERDNAEAIIERLRPQLARIPGIRVFIQAPSSIQLGGRLTTGMYQYTLMGGDTDKLFSFAQKLEQKMRGLKELVDVSSDLKVKSQQLDLVIDRDRASTEGVTASAIENTLFDAFASRQVSTIYAAENTYQVILEVLPEEQRDPAALGLLYVKSTSGALVPLDEVSHVSTSAAPLAINHSGQLPSVTISFNLPKGTALGDAVKAIESITRGANALPAGVTSSFQGTAQVFQSSLRGEGGLLVIAILVIYLVLGVLYESFVHPLTILSALPFAGFGALVTLLIFGETLSIYAFVGIIMLIGLVKKNGIMMIDFALEAQRTGRPADESIFEASIIRFRPIMMTTMAALMGTLPIALGVGAGSEVRRPLGLAVVGGLFFSQFLTLFATPAFFLWMDSLRHLRNRRIQRPGRSWRRRHRGPTEPVSSPALTDTERSPQAARPGEKS